MSVGTSVTTAAEVTKILPEPTAKEPLLGVGVFASIPGRIVLTSGKTLECSKAKSEGEFTTSNLGTGHTTLEGCTAEAGLARCTGEGDGGGTLLDSGTIHYVLALEMISSTTTTLVAAAVTLLHPFHLTCEALGIKELVVARGCLAARDESKEILTNHISLIARQWTTGETKILEILPPEARSETDCLFEVAIFREGAEQRFELGAVEGEGAIERIVKDEEGGRTKLITVLLMN
jgi:hypothetical protein